MKVPPAQKPVPGEAGFILIEVLVSALVITIVAGAVLALVSATTRSAATERTQAEAYGLAQEDQAQMRTMRIAKLERLNSERKETLNGTTFTIRSQGVYVNSKTGNESCTEGESSADYVRITSTVSAPTLHTPVTMQSIVAPSTGSVDANHGTISFSVKNGAGQGLSGVLLEGTGTANFSGSTDESGCAVFSSLTPGNYKVTASAAGMINPAGETSTKKEIGVLANGTQVVSLLFDRGGTVEPKFVYRVGSSSELLPAAVDSMALFNSESGSSALLSGTPGGTRTPTLKKENLFPFKTKYTIYAGSCETSNPDPKEEKPENDAALAKVAVPAGETVSPAPQIQVPALNLTLTSSGSPVSGARVTVTDSQCKYNSVNVKRVFTTNSGGHLASPTTGVEEPGLPWGKYTVCASVPSGSSYRKVETSSPVAVENLSTGTSLALSLPTTTTSTPCP